MKKQAKADKHPQGPISVTIRKNRPLAVLGIVASLIIGVGIAAYATNNLLHGHVRVNRTVEKADAPTVSENKNAGTQSAASFKATADLVDKYGPAAKSQAVAVAINSAQSLVSTKTSAKAASNRYEALQHGYWTPGTDPMQAIMHGYIPPGMPPQQAAMLYNALPRNARIPIMPQATTPQRIAAMAGEPADPLAGLPQGMSRDGVEAANQKMFDGYIRERFGPVYVPPLHRGHNHAPDPAVSKVATAQDHQGSIREMVDASGNIVAQYSYDPYGRQARIAGSGPDADFGYQGYYVYQRSGLNLTATRAYSPVLGRFLNRDPIGESGGTNLYAYVGNDPIRYTDPSGMAIWIEGPSGTEPFPHKSICVGNPNGKYDCISFCINPSLPNGKVYYDPMQGGTILRYKVTTPDQDAKFLAGLPKIGTPDWYGPCNSCRTFSEKQFDNAPGVEAPPPSRPPVGSNPPPFGWTTPPAQ